MCEQPALTSSFGLRNCFFMFSSMRKEKILNQLNEDTFRSFNCTGLGLIIENIHKFENKVEFGIWINSCVNIHILISRLLLSQTSLCYYSSRILVNSGILFISNQIKRLICYLSSELRNRLCVGVFQKYLSLVILKSPIPVCLVVSVCSTCSS